MTTTHKLAAAWTSPTNLMLYEMTSGPFFMDSVLCRARHTLHLVCRRFNEALREPCEAWRYLQLHARQLIKVRHAIYSYSESVTSVLLHAQGL